MRELGKGMFKSPNFVTILKWSPIIFPNINIVIRTNLPQTISIENLYSNMDISLGIIKLMAKLSFKEIASRKILKFQTFTYQRVTSI